MKQKKLWIGLFLCCILAVIITKFVDYSREQKELYQRKIIYVRSVQEKEKEWIRQNQGSQGQIYLNYTDNGAGDVNPYFACLAAQGLLTGEVTEKDLEHVKRYLIWHREHFLAEKGAISNYRLTEGELLSQKEKDSVDSYTAVFLSLLCKYGEKGGAMEQADPDGEAMLLGLRTLEKLWVDGLTTVSEENQVRYLMDNIEVQAALIDVRVYLENLNDKWMDADTLQTCTDKLDQMIEESRDSIENLLWNKEEARYDVGLGDSGRVLDFESWEMLYPDAAAQIYGAAFLSDWAKSSRTKTLYKKFCSIHDWEHMSLSNEEEFDWAVFSFAAAAVKDRERAETYLKIYEKRISRGREYPIHTAEAGWVSKTCDKLEQQYQAMIDRNFFEVIFDWIKERVE